MGFPRAFVVCALLIAACSSGSGDSAPVDTEVPTSGEVANNDSSSDTDAPETESGSTAGSPSRSIVSDANDQYVFSRLGMTAGGWVTGIVAHPEVADVMYVRTDVGGAHRWNAQTESWEQMVTASSIDDRDAGAALYNVESVAVAATDAERVYLSVGGDAQLDAESFSQDGRVLRSDDGGRTWTSSTSRFYISGNAPFRQQGERLAVDPLQADVLMLGTRRQGVWVSTDGGDTFDNISNDLVPFAPADDPASAQDAGISFVTPDPAGGATSDGRTARWYVGVGGVGVMRTDDGGDTWTSIRSVPPTVVPQEGEVVDGQLFVAFNDPGGVPATVERYEPDAGWMVYDLPPEITIWSLAVDPADPERVMIATEAVRTGGVFYTEDGGRSWSNPVVRTSAPDAPWIGEANDGGYMPVGKFIFDPHESERLWFAEGIGVWTTFAETDFLDWEFVGAGIEELVVTDFATAGTGATVSAVADFQGFVHDDVNAAPSQPLIDSRFAGGTSLDYVGGSPEQLVWIGAEYNIYWNPDRRSRAARSFDGGATWEELPNLDKDQFGGNIAVSAGDPDNIVWVPSNLLSPFEYLDIPKGVFVTTDGGENWTRLADIDGKNTFHRLMWWFSRQALTADRVQPNTFYLMGEEEDFYVSTNGGLDWEAAPHAAPCTVSVTCHVYGQIHADPFTAERVWSASGEAGLYVTDDAGRSEWRRIDAVDSIQLLGFGAPIGDSSEPALFIHGRVDGDPDLGIWRSADGGESFELIAREPYDSFANIVVIEGDMDVPGRVYVGFGGSGAVYGDDTELNN